MQRIRVQCLCSPKVRCVSIAATNLHSTLLLHNSLFHIKQSVLSIKVRETPFRQSCDATHLARQGGLPQSGCDDDLPHSRLCRLEKRTVSICPFSCTKTGWNSISTTIGVESQRITRNKQETETRYYISDLTEDATSFARRIRGYWGVENKVHYSKDVTFGEDKSRIRNVDALQGMPQIWSIARNLALNLYRDAGFNNMAQGKRKSQFCPFLE